MGCCCSKPIFMIALFDYEAVQGKQISLTKGDRCKLLDRVNNDWCRVTNLNTRQDGMVPYNYIATEGTAGAEDWFFAKISRREAEELLLSDRPVRGLFLIRQSENYEHPFSLSVKDFSNECFVIKHFRIKFENLLYYYGPRHKFKTLKELADYYKNASLSRNSHLNLTRACMKVKPLVFYEWEIDRRELALHNKLGQGNFGDVYYGIWHKTEVAVKTLRPDTMTKDQFLIEAEMMKTVRHPKLVSLYGVCTETEPIYIVQEFMPNGSLLDYLRKCRNLNLNDFVFFATQVADGMAYLEEHRLIHRDLAARNVLVGHSKIVKIGDFGLARALTYDEYKPREIGMFPVKWTAPEAMEYEIYSTKSDVWSYGILLMEIFTYGGVPYPGMHPDDVRTAVLHRGYRMENPPKYNIPEDIYNMMLGCWAEKPENRPTFEYLFHYFENYAVSSEANYHETADNEVNVNDLPVPERGSKPKYRTHRSKKR